MDLAALLTGGGVLSLLAIGFIYLLAGNRADRVDYRKELADERTERERLETLLDEERKRRRAAEDREAKLAREVAGLSERVEHLSAEVARLRAQLGLVP